MTISTRDYSVVITDPAMKALASVAIQEGIYGIKFYNGDVYFSSTFGDIFSKVKIDQATGKAGVVTSILTSLQGPEDFAISADGTSYLAVMTQGQVLKITLDGKSSTAGSVASCTCVAFGQQIKMRVRCMLLQVGEHFFHSSKLDLMAPCLCMHDMQIYDL